MAFKLSEVAQDRQKLVKQEPELVLEIDGYDKIFGMNKILKFIKIGQDGLVIGDDWVIGGSSYDKNSNDYISIDGTTSSISQQLLQDKGGTSSITSFQVSLIDFRGEMTELISPGFVLDDILGREAIVYIGYKNSNFPSDYVILFNGIIDEVESGATIKLNIANPELKKRQEIYPVIETETVGAINSSQTTIPLKETANYQLPVASIISTYVKIDDEIIRYTGINTGTNTLTGCTRAQFDTIAVAHDDAASVSSFIRMQGNAIDLSLQLMLSGGDEYYKENISITNFGQDGDGNTNLNGIFFVEIDVKTKLGLTVGDFITTTGAANGANNFTLRTVTSISTTINGSFVVVDGSPLVLEAGSTALAKIKSRYNVLNDGLGFGANQVDVDEFNRIYDLFSSSIPVYDFYITETIKGKEFIDTEILFPANLFSLPKKGKTSLGVVSPPLAVASLPVLNADVVSNPQSIRIKRAIGKYFYNTVIYKFNFDAVQTDKPLTGYIRVDEDSKNQIKVGTKAMTIIGRGLRNDADTLPILDINSIRILEKYKYAAEAITLSVFYGIGFNIDVGDVVLFGDENLNLPDSLNGVRGFKPRLCEVIDKKMNIITGSVQLTIIDTSYLSSGRYGIISPSSNIGSGSTIDSLIIVDSYSTVFPEIEKNKWIDYIGQKILIHNDDYSISYNSKILGFDPTNDYRMYIETIPSASVEGFTVDIAFYPNTTVASDNLLLKNVFVFTNPNVTVISGVSEFEFEVGPSDVSKFLVGATILVHNEDFSTVSPEVRVESISGNFITVDKTLGFVPSSSETVDLIGFIDGGSAYRYL